MYFLGLEALFECFLDVRGSLKVRLSVKIFHAKANEFYSTWLCQKEDEVPEENCLKFSKTWIKGWMKEYGVCL